jgi:integrase
LGEVLRRHKGGRFIGYYLRFYEGGRRRQLASKQASYADARRMLIEIEARIARGEVGIPERRHAPSFAALIERFLAEYSRPRLKDLASYRARARARLQSVLPQLGALPCDHVKAADINRLRDQLLARSAAGTVRNTLSTISAVFSWAIRQGLLRENPCRGVEKPAASASLEFFTAQEVRALLHVAATRAATGEIAAQLQQARLWLALHTGLRKGELCGLRWCDLDLRSRRLTVSRSYRTTPKSGKSRTLRLPDVVLPILTDWAKHCPRTPEGLVFPVPSSRGFAMSAHTGDMLGLPALLTEAGCRPLPHCWHALRHTFASHFIMAGGNLLSLQKILGHSDVKVTMIYAHLAPDFLADEMNRVRF